MVPWLTHMIPLWSFSWTQFNWHGQLPGVRSHLALFVLPDLFKAFEKDRSHRWELLLRSGGLQWRSHKMLAALCYGSMTQWTDELHSFSQFFQYRIYLSEAKLPYNPLCKVYHLSHAEQSPASMVANQNSE